MPESSPVHTTSAPGTRWSRVNYAEAIQGVQTPLGWTLWENIFNRAPRHAFVAIGVLPRSELDAPAVQGATTDANVFSACFHGRPAANVSMFHRIGELMPGTSGDALIEQIFGEHDGLPAGSQLPARGRARRYAAVAAKFAPAAIRFERMVVPMREDHRRWWRAGVIERPPMGLEEATARLREAGDRFAHAGAVHVVASFVAQALVDQVDALARQAWGTTEGAADLTTGIGGMEEALMMADIWAVASGSLAFEELLARHGYHGPNEGALDSLVWREDPGPAHRLVERYREAGIAHPAERQATQAARRRDAERRLAAALGPIGRERARLTLRLARRVVPKRELGKAAYLHAIDAARCAARAIGRELEARSVLEDAEDVFFLTFEELTHGIDTPVGDLVAQRRAQHASFEALELPTAWTGNPVATPAMAEPARRPEVTRELQGVGVTGELVTGRARVVFDPDDADLEPGDVLVCRTTDPSWTPLFLLADALVIDTGGVMSHGAIVARELGVPCVINTQNGTRVIPDGAMVSVDGRSGAVRLLEPSAPAVADPA